jgi:hypothetical protein
MASPIAANRMWRSRTDLTQFVESVKQWHDLRLADTFPSVLGALKRELLATAEKLEDYLGNAGRGSPSTADVYGTCARVDTALSWLQRVFAFFREKIDQRTGPLERPLHAADEVVWSAFRAFAPAKNEPAPLVYIDAQYSPAAIRRDRSLGALVDRGSGFEFLRDYLKTLPIPMLRLPVAVVESPWTLAVIGHEVGHFVQPLIEEGYPDSFAARIVETARAAGASAEDANAWGESSGEIFADWYSIGVMGPWALWAMAQFELGSEELMRQRRAAAGYPSAVARLELMRQLADALSPVGMTFGSKVAETIGVSLAANERSTPAELQDRAVAAALAQRLAVTPLGIHGSLADAVGYKSADHEEPVAEGKGEVALWAGTLTGRFNRHPKRKLYEARYIAAASARAAAEATLDDTDAARKTFNDSLRENTFTKIVASKVEGTRATNDKPIVIAAPGEHLSSLLLGLDLPAEMPLP